MACGSARWSAGGSRRRRCCCRGARRPSPRRPRSRAAAIVSWSCPCRSSPRRDARRAPAGPRPASAGAISPRSHTPPIRPRRGWIACSAPGASSAMQVTCAPTSSCSWPGPVHRNCNAPACARRKRRGFGCSAGSDATSTAACSAARACSCALPAARTTGSRSSRRSQTAVSWSALHRRAPTSRWRSRAGSTRGSSTRTSHARCARLSATPCPAMPRRHAGRFVRKQNTLLA